MNKTLIILNPHAGSGRAGRVWKEIEPLLWEYLGELVVAVTQRQEDVAYHLGHAYASGLTRVISIGGDGTNHALVNALADLNSQHPDGAQMVYGNLPIGSGMDWARCKGVPFDIKAAARWVADATPQATDVGLLTYDEHREHFLNIASMGVSGEIGQRVNGVKTKRPWTYLQQTVTGILRHTPNPVRVWLDGKEWYEGSAYLVAVANGTTFGHGMKIAPNAQTNDGLFDVILVKGVARATILSALYRVYDASHLTHPAVRFAQAKEVEIRRDDKAVPLELDGEPQQGRHLHFSLRPGLLQMLAQ